MRRSSAVAPIFPSRDWLEYLILERGEVGLLFFHAAGLDPWTSIAGCIVYVEDADALYADIPRLHGPPIDTDYGMREFAVVDPDGNLLRIGSLVPPSAPEPG